MIEIRHRHTDRVLHTSEKETILEAVTEALANDVDLSGANLSGANLYGANLSGANLSGAYLYEAYLSGANLYGANLSGANLSGANLYGIRFSWSNHTLISHLLMLKAGKSVTKRKIAGLILVSTDWCWPEFLNLKGRAGFDWAIRTLAAHVRDDDRSTPEILVEAAAKLKAEASPQDPEAEAA